jgi:hypothetical protein
MKKSTLAFVFYLVVGVCIVLAAKVTTDYDHSVNFGRYQTYSWLKVEAGDPLWIDRIRSAVDSQVLKKGWTPIPVGGDASVSAFGSSHKQPRLETFYTGFGGGWFWRGFGGGGIATTDVEYTPVGTLVVDIFDTPTKKLIWRGVASDALSDKPEKNEKKLEKVVEEMFKHFPPKPKD